MFANKSTANPIENPLNDAMATEVIPNAYGAIPGTATFLGPLANAQRTYQLLIQSTQLTSLVGKNLSGFNMRIRGTGN